MVDPNEADLFGFGPQTGHPLLHLPDGRRVAISYAEYPLPLWIMGVMTYELRVGAWTWTMAYEITKWEAITPSGGVADDRVLSVMIERAGGPAPFIVQTIAKASEWLMTYLGFAPHWQAQDSLQNVNAALTGWGLKSIVPMDPTLLVLPYPK